MYCWKYLVYFGEGAPCSFTLGGTIAEFEAPLRKVRSIIYKSSTIGRGKRRKERLQQGADVIPVKQGLIPALRTERVFYGATYLFDQIGELTGVRADLKVCFPDTYKQILSIAYYLILEDENPLYRFSKWGKLHRHPYGKDISSQRSGELFQSITEEQKMKFFRLKGEWRSENEYWAYDTTSISGYSETLRQVKYGKNKDGDHLPQINLAYCSVRSRVFRSTTGSLPGTSRTSCAGTWKGVSEILRDQGDS